MRSGDLTSYRIPGGVHRMEIRVSNSRFITTIAPARSVDEARVFVGRIRSEMPDASHHVYAFRVGYGNSVTEGMSDDGEPSGTAGPPALTVLRGADIGDIVMVITRYFGGAKLGTGGLVRAYSEAARSALETLVTELKIPRQLLRIEMPYSYYEPVKRLMARHQGTLKEETFADAVSILAVLPAAEVTPFTRSLGDLTAGQVIPVVLESYS